MKEASFSTRLFAISCWRVGQTGSRISPQMLPDGARRRHTCAAVCAPSQIVLPPGAFQLLSFVWVIRWSVWKFPTSYVSEMLRDEKVKHPNCRRFDGVFWAWGWTWTPPRRLQLAPAADAHTNVELQHSGWDGGRKTNDFSRQWMRPTPPVSGGPWLARPHNYGRAERWYDPRSLWNPSRISSCGWQEGV